MWGRIERFVFDKTGTLTEPSLEFGGIMPQKGGDGKDLDDYIDTEGVANYFENGANLNFKLGIITCNTVVQSDDGEYIGNWLECEL